MPPEYEDQYECDQDAVDRMYEGCETYRHFDDEDPYEPAEENEMSDLREALDAIDDNAPAMEPEPEPEPEEVFELTLGEIRLDGEKWNDLDAATSRERVDAALREAVKLWGVTGQPVELEIFVDKTVDRNGQHKNLCRKISIMVDRAMEMDEAIFPEELAEDDWVRIWLEENDIPGERTPEKEREDGMSWVHFEVKKGGEITGRVSACVRPGETSRHVEVAFAFCRGSLPFSKRQGRIISRDRMEAGVTVTVIKNKSRYETVQDILKRALHGEKHWNCTEDNATEKFPPWLYPHYREDIPEDVMDLLEKIYTDIGTKAGIRDEIGVMLSRDIKQRADVKLEKILSEKA